MEEWRPLRRLRHVEGVALRNLYAPLPSGRVSRSVANQNNTFYHFVLEWFDEGCGLWHVCYCSEQVASDMHLCWDPILRDSLSVPDHVLHDPEHGRFLLRFYASTVSNCSAGKYSTRHTDAASTLETKSISSNTDRLGKHKAGFLPNIQSISGDAISKDVEGKDTGPAFTMFRSPAAGNVPCDEATAPATPLPGSQQHAELGNKPILSVFNGPAATWPAPAFGLQNSSRTATGVTSTRNSDMHPRTECGRVHDFLQSHGEAVNDKVSGVRLQLLYPAAIAEPMQSAGELSLTSEGWVRDVSANGPLHDKPLIVHLEFQQEASHAAALAHEARERTSGASKVSALDNAVVHAAGPGTDGVAALSSFTRGDTAISSHLSLPVMCADSVFQENILHQDLSPSTACGCDHNNSLCQADQTATDQTARLRKEGHEYNQAAAPWLLGSQLAAADLVRTGCGEHTRPWQTTQVLDVTMDNGNAASQLLREALGNPALPQPDGGQPSGVSVCCSDRASQADCMAAGGRSSTCFAGGKQCCSWLIMDVIIELQNLTPIDMAENDDDLGLNTVVLELSDGCCYTLPVVGRLGEAAPSTTASSSCGFGHENWRAATLLKAAAQQPSKNAKVRPTAVAVGPVPGVHSSPAQQQQLLRWMVDNSSIVEPLVSQDSLDAATEQLVGTSLVSSVGSHLVSDSGFLPSVMALLFGQGLRQALQRDEPDPQHSAADSVISIGAAASCVRRMGKRGRHPALPQSSILQNERSRPETTTPTTAREYELPEVRASIRRLVALQERLADAHGRKERAKHRVGQLLARRDLTRLQQIKLGAVCNGHGCGTTSSCHISAPGCCNTRGSGACDMSSPTAATGSSSDALVHAGSEWHIQQDVTSDGDGSGGAAKRVATAEAQLKSLQAQTEALRWQLLVRVEALCLASLSLLHAEQRRLNADSRLHGAEGTGHWKSVHAKLVGRRNRLVAELARAYQVGPENATQVAALQPSSLEQRLEQWWAGAADPEEVGSDNSGSFKAVDPSAFFGAASANWSGRAGSSKGKMAPLPTTSAQLCIMGLDVSPGLAKRSLEGVVGWNGDYDEEQRVAAALGYVAHLVDRCATYLDIPLRYPVRPAMSKSYILDPSPAMGEYDLQEGVLKRQLQRLTSFAKPSGWGRSNNYAACHSSNSSKGSSVIADSKLLIPTELPLFYEGRDRTRFAYAIFLLNKDVEQLLQAHGLMSAGPNAMLQNLYVLVAAASAAVPDLASKHQHQHDCESDTQRRAQIAGRRT